MRIARFPVLAVPLIALLATALLAEPLALVFEPEAGLEITYDLEAKGTRVMRVPGQAPVTAKIGFKAQRVDAFEGPGGAKMAMTRTLKDIRLTEDGQRQEIPSSIRDKAVAFTADSRGNIIAVDKEWAAGAPEGFGDILNLLETVPFGTGPVEIGDKWDASAPEDPDSKSVAEIIKDVSEGQIVAIYESDGMQVALIQQHVDAEMLYKDTPQEGLNMRASLRAEILQSNRVEDGALLGIKGKLYQKIEVVSPQGATLLSIEMPDLEGTLRVAAE
jgi:hypothetical protein